MAVWFARQSGNINAANTWNSAPDGSGSWLTWPPASGDILVTNSYIITVNVSVDLGNGQFRGDAYQGATNTGRFTITATGLSMTGDVYSGLGASASFIYFGGTGTFTLVGNVYADGTTITAGRYATYNQSTGTFNITGNMYGGTGGINSRCLWNHGAGTVNITGDVYGYTGSATISNNSTGAVHVTGNMISEGGPVFSNASTGPLTVSGYAQASNAAAGISNASTGIVTVGETRSAANGRGAVWGAFRYASATAAKAQPIIAGAQKTLSVLDVATLAPAAKDVRAGVTYGDGAYTGTLALNRKRASMAGRF